MKTKIIIGILSVALLFSVGGNVWLYRSAAEAETLQGKIAELEGREAERKAKETEQQARDAEQQAMVSGLEEQIDINMDKDIDLSDPNVDLYDQDVIDKTGGWVAVMTGIPTSRDELIQLVIDSVEEAKVEVGNVEQEAENYARPETEIPETPNASQEVEGSITPVVIPTLLAKVRDVNSDLDEQFVIEASDGEMYNPFDPGSETWSYTYNMWASVLGDYVHYHPEGATFNEYAGSMSGAYHGLIAYDVFDFDMTKATDWNVGGVADTEFVEHMPIYWKVEFTYNNDVYVGLIGLVNDKYDLIDIVRSGDPDTAWVNQVTIQYEDTTETIPDYDNSTIDANAGGAESFIPDDDPSVNPDVMNEDPGEEYIPGTGGLTITEMDASDMPMAPGFDGNTEFNSGYDPNDPHPLPGMY